MVAIELFTKLVEATAIKKAIGSLMANLLKKNIVCRFEVPSNIISDNGTPFLNKDVRRLTEWYSISPTTSTPYYPKGNGQAETSNKRLLKILGKMMKENEKGWREELPTALWAHGIAKSQTIGASPFSLVYNTKVVILIDLVRPTVKLAKILRVPREVALEIVEEKRNNAVSHNRLY